MNKLTGSIRGLDMSKFVISFDHTFSGTLNLAGESNTTMDNEQSGVVRRQPVAGAAPSFPTASSNKTPLLAQQPMVQYAAGPYGPPPGGVHAYGGVPGGFQQGYYGQQQPVGNQGYHDSAPPQY
jgi:hypothetical protein